MNVKSVLTIAALSAVFSAAAHAGEADFSSNLPRFEGQRTRAEVRADAVQAVQNRNPEPAGSRIAAPVKSTLSVQAVREQAAAALRQGQITTGDQS
ncbi:MAG TPA: DUF4148 domain-containing protein [Ramlibacter sp.]|uniref:DUF4148 domain-containing protein n=1 Tax=Ramlibacter sp. TaxID=1917967 RepID=UPI002D5E9652|nr:DUF4148 domain-containing protein [Ramlibacter sp.]HZY17723.1 DUF4148 domain-containing protein [Ramlibacter sp.]